MEKMFDIVVYLVKQQCRTSSPQPQRGAVDTVKPKNHAKIALDITADEFDRFYLYTTGTITIYDRLSL